MRNSTHNTASLFAMLAMDCESSDGMSRYDDGQAIDRIIETDVIENGLITSASVTENGLTINSRELTYDLGNNETVLVEMHESVTVDALLDEYETERDERILQLHI